MMRVDYAPPPRARQQLSVRCAAKEPSGRSIRPYTLKTATCSTMPSTMAVATFEFWCGNSPLETAASLTPFNKNGRASGSERACRYVQDPVVAGHVKKKTALQ